MFLINLSSKVYLFFIQTSTTKEIRTKLTKSKILNNGLSKTTIFKCTLVYFLL